MSTALDDVKKIAVKYFGDIVYIDDALKKPDDIMKELFEVGKEMSATVETPNVIDGQPEVKSFKFRPRNIPNQNKGNSETQTNTEGNSDVERIPNAHLEWIEYRKAFNLVFDFQKKGCKVSPFYYSKDVECFNAASTLLEKSHLTILDWELDANNGDTTIKLLRKAFAQRNQMKLIVIYTNNPLDASAQIAKDFKAVPKQKRLQEDNPVDYFNLKNCLLLVCGKDSFSASKILDLFIDLLIEEFGLFPFVFFDAINKITNGTAMILNRFTFPFENTLMLQLQSSGLDTHYDYAEVVSKMISNHISEIVDIDPKIFESIVSDWTNKTDALMKLDDRKLAERINSFLDDMISKQQNTNKAGEKNVEILENLKLLSGADWRNGLNKFKNQKQLYNPDKRTNYSEFIFDKLTSALVSKEYSRLALTFKDEGKGDAFEKIKKEYLEVFNRTVRDKYREPFFRLLPPLFVYLLSKESSEELVGSQAELVRLMKLIPYAEGKKSIKHDGRVKNYFKTGDILFNGSKFLLCISPSCDVFRPKKVYNKLKFMIGEVVINDDPEKVIKDSEHYSILPNPQREHDLICVKWSCSLTEVYDINDDLKELKKYTRPYRFDSVYCQQIINKYIAYHSRAGVDELYIKEHSSSRNLFVSTTGIKEHPDKNQKADKYYKRMERGAKKNSKKRRGNK